MSWQDFWESNTGNKRLFRAVAEDYFYNFKMVFSFNKETRVLDYGCGHGYLASLLAESMGEVYIYDISSAMLEKARTQNGKRRNVIVIDKLFPDKIPPLDYILVNSVIQYINPDKFIDILRLWGLLLQGDGKIVISDIIPYQVIFLNEILGLLRYSFSKGYLIGQIGQLASLFFSNFRRVAEECPLTIYPQHLLCELATKTELTIEFLEKNLVYGKYRYSASFRKK